jgi:hypothetical protein
MTQSNPQLQVQSSRAEGRDYVLQPSATVALLPAIAEEKSHPPPGYHKSVSMVETSRLNGQPHHQDLLSQGGGWDSGDAKEVREAGLIYWVGAKILSTFLMCRCTGSWSWTC